MPKRGFSEAKFGSQARFSNDSTRWMLDGPTIPVEGPKGVGYAMWCLIRVDFDDKTFWLTEPNSEGNRSLVSKVDSATTFWDKERAQEAINKFVALNPQLADHVKLVALDTQHYRGD